jgi:hypothetical protein
MVSKARNIGKGASVITKYKRAYEYYYLRTFRTRVVVISTKID